MSFIIFLIVLGLSVCLSAMIVAYDSLSKYHLKHWAKKKEQSAGKLYPLKAGGSEVKITLELVRAFFVAIALAMLAADSGFVSLIVFYTAILFMLVMLAPKVYLKNLGLRLLIMFADLVLDLTRFMRPIVRVLAKLLDRVIKLEPVTLTKDDLSEMLKSVDPTDTDISKDELKILTHTLTFSNKKVHDVMTPKKVMTSVKIDEKISPVFIDSLYKSGHSRFPVFDTKSEEVVGTLYLHDLVDLSAAGLVKDHMQKRSFYVHEDQDLQSVFQAFFKTKHHMFVVVNSFAEIVGLVTIEDVIEQIIGRLIVDEFDKHDDLRAVAELQGKKHRTQNRDNMVE